MVAAKKRAAGNDRRVGTTAEEAGLRGCSAFWSNLFGLAQMIAIVRKLPSE
jgi:hypothetical protein